jgi:antirestriction protein ArdC
MTANKPTDVYQLITDQIVTAIENGPGEWQMPWHRGALGRPANALTGKAYRGVNVLALWVAAMQRGYGSDLWGTYRQWRTKGAQVRKGEKANLIVFYKEIVDEDADAGTPAAQKRIMLARASWVFNADQVDGFTAPAAAPQTNQVDIIARAEAFVKATDATITHGGGVACYSPMTDDIRMPERASFFGSKTSTPTECYYSTLLHELTHWSGHASRCDRQLAPRFNKNAYAMEELVAELGAAFLCADLAITNTPRPDHAAYLGHWLAIMREDKRAIFTAASKAAQAADYLAGFSAQTEKEAV